jgi:tetratricopeptide (TPR) repeat protein
MIPRMGANAQSSLNPKPAPAGRKTKRVDAVKKYWWAAAIAVPLLGAVIGILPSLLKKEAPSISISRDSHDLNFQPITVIEREYRQKTGQPLPPDVQQQIEQALQLLKQERYEDGIPLLRAAAQKAPTPSVLTDLGNALATTGKSTEAQAVYSRVESLDPANQQVTGGRRFLAKLTGNNTILTAAEIPMQTVIPATLLDNDTDFFKFTAPSGPRDHLRVRLQNRSTSLGLTLAVKDAEKAPIGETSGAAAANITYEFPATPSAIHYLQVSPYYSGGGAYSLIVEPTHSFDAYEPNDTILTAKDIATGRLIEANIMDERDTDFYRFHARGAKTSIVVENRSDTLGIALAVTNADKAPVGEQSGAAAANVRYEFVSIPGSTYYLQISPYYSPGGKYAFTIQ